MICETPAVASMSNPVAPGAQLASSPLDIPLVEAELRKAGHIPAEPAEATAVYGTVEQSPRVLRPTLLRSL